MVRMIRKSNTPHPRPSAKIPKVLSEIIFKLNKKGIDAINAPVNIHKNLIMV
jgi:effector-binding domain-containing protein